MSESTAQTVLFPDLTKKPVHTTFDEPAATSDGGALLLGALDRSLGLSNTLAGCLYDDREPGKIEHSLADLLRQRLFAISCGYVDANDAARLKSDMTQKVVVGRDPVQGDDLASQPTLSRFENSVSGSDCFRLGSALAEMVLRRHKRRLGQKKVKRITIDLDGSVDPTHGQQELTLFNNYYKTWCYFPLFGFVTFNGEPEQYLFAAILRSGCAKEAEASLCLLARVVPFLKELFPRAKIRVRLDAGFNGPALFDLLDNLGVEYLVAIAKNSVLGKDSKKLMAQVRKQSNASKSTVKLFGETQYSAGSWKGTTRRVIFKAERLVTPWHDAKDNERYVVTNLKLTPKNVYKEYCGRGDVENRIKELKDDLEVDRTSCSRASANQFRMILTAAAYILYQELRLRASRTSLRRAQVAKLRIALIKIGGVVKMSLRRITFHLSENHPWAREWRIIAAACGAT